MTPAEAVTLLAYVSAFDNRQLEEAHGEAWAQVLDPRLTLDAAKWIVNEHYKTSRQWLMPADINTKYKAVRKERLDRVGTNIDVPHDLDADRHQDYLNAYHDAIANGAPDPDTARATACRQIGHDPAPLQLVADPERITDLINNLKAKKA